MKQHVVKVQLPLATNADVPCALVYDQRRTIEGEFPVTRELVNTMKGEPKMFFYATLVPNHRPKGTYSVKLGKPAPWQEW